MRRSGRCLLALTCRSNSSAGTLATRTAVICWRSDIPAASAASRWEILVTATSLFLAGRPLSSNSFSSSPERLIARDRIRMA